MIVNNVFDIKSNPIFLKLENFIKTPQCYLKIEGLNVARSIKIKPAAKIIESLEKQYGEGLKDKVIICSSSGNLAIAMSIICKVKGYGLLCISDVLINKINKKLIKLYGSKLKIIKEKDKKGGYLAKRIEYIKNLLKTSERYTWCNQYGNEANVEAHYETTAREIFKEIPKVTHLFVGAGTTGTLMGCVKYFKKHSPKTKIIAVDAVGSVTFGKKAAKRRIPGLGTSRKPEIADASLLDDIVYVEERDTLKECHNFLKQRGILLGGSSGTVLSAVKNYPLDSKAVVVTISPDLGDKYLETVYNDSWLKTHYGIKGVDDDRQ
jgi:N-(2-amino-2-carboxyethyl)-L-glutamate synthase